MTSCTFKLSFFGRKDPLKYYLRRLGLLSLIIPFYVQKVDEDRLFNLFSLYGNIVRIKILRNKPDHALVEMVDGLQAELAVHYLKVHSDSPFSSQITLFSVHICDFHLLSWDAYIFAGRNSIWQETGS